MANMYRDDDLALRVEAAIRKKKSKMSDSARMYMDDAGEYEGYRSSGREPAVRSQARKQSNPFSAFEAARNIRRSAGKAK